MTLRVAFRADASVIIGTGHVMRCLTLAEALRARGADCLFVTRELQGHLAAFISKRGFAVSLLPPPSGRAPKGPPGHAAWAGVTWQQDLSDTRAVVHRADWMIIDHYAFDARWQRGLTDRIGYVMAIDDLADRQHVATLLLDQNLGRALQDYDCLIPDEARRLIGPRYALLRPEFASLREVALVRRCGARVSHLMISMGGTDAPNATLKVLRAIAIADLPSKLRISVVMGSRAPALENVRAMASGMRALTTVLVDVSDMAQLMTEADVAIGAGGSTTWERCCLGLPSIIVETASNQAGAVAAMEKAGAALGTGSPVESSFDERLVAALGQLLDPNVNARLSRAAAELCDGQGADLVARSLEEYA